MTWEETKRQLAAMDKKPNIGHFLNWFLQTKCFGIPYYPEDATPEEPKKK